MGFVTSDGETYLQCDYCGDSLRKEPDESVTVLKRLATESGWTVKNGHFRCNWCQDVLDE